MLMGILRCALPAGIIAGIFSAVLQIWLTSPIIIKAEEFEATALQTQVEAQTQAGAQAQESEGHSHSHGGSTLKRHLFTAMAAMVIYTGFALMTCSILILRGCKVNIQIGLFWGLAGFVVFAFAPAIGLPPELPGSHTADLTQRQIWWLGTVLMTAIGLWLLVFNGVNWHKNWLLICAGILCLFIPHIIGAPHPIEIGGILPAELAAVFVSRSLAVSALSWISLGLLLGFLYEREMEKQIIEST